MKVKITYLILLAFLNLVSTATIQSQPLSDNKIDSVFRQQGEIYFTFNLTRAEKDLIHKLTRIISIDKVTDRQVFAYANRAEFSMLKSKFPDIRIQLLQAPGTSIAIEELGIGGLKLPQGTNTTWNFYPNYDQYLGFMAGFATDHPSICKLDTIGTTIQGRLILAVRISDNVNQDEAEPQFLYTSSIHGDETAGYVLMLHLIDHLLLNYGTDQEVTDLVNSTEIYINPLANPDGTYHGGNNSVFGATRYNANNIDLNRNFPDPKVGQHPDGNAWQVETIAWMEYASNHRFSMSANFHGGAEVFNFPWDTWSKLHADDNWWEFVGREWADTAHKYAPAGYFTLMNNGVTNGYAWYELNGGRQDYMNYWHNCREVTLEISNIKTLPASQLINWWNYNNRSFINYMKQAGYGASGIVTDTVTDQPVAAKVFIQGHDFDNSEVYSHLPTGFYSRYLIQDTYDLTFSAPGYFTKTISGVNVTNRNSTILDVQLRPLTYDAQDKVESGVLIFPNPTSGIFRIQLSDAPVRSDCSVQVINALGKIVDSVSLDCSSSGPVTVNMAHLSNGIYFLKFNTGYRVFLDKLIIRK
jgi:hypothetical protein